MTMDIIDKRIYSCNEAICKNIESLQANERGLLSQNILSQLRNFLECVFLKIYVASGNSKRKKLPLTFYQADDGICRHSHRLL